VQRLFREAALRGNDGMGGPKDVTRQHLEQGVARAEFQRLTASIDAFNRPHMQL
jgi:hypothetical protein